MTRIAVLGAGAFGTALAIQIARRTGPTVLWGRQAEAMNRMQVARQNDRYLADCHFPPELEATANLDHALAAEHLLLAVPSHALGDTLATLAPRLRPEQGLVCASKGLEPGRARLPHDIFRDHVGDAHRYAVLSGPTFAREMGMGLPTALVVASRDTDFAETIGACLHGDGFIAYTSDDVPGVEIGGATKNVLAIAVGVADGMRLGANTRAALIARGLNELVRLAEAAGARAETLMGLSGLGDLVLTCTDDQSRNRRLGLRLGRGEEVDAAIAAIGTVEGARAAPEVLRLARRHRIHMPISEQVAALLAGEITAVQAVRALAARSVRPETE
jgi:glycerol 3-phosphate dehydrogenase (NAD(P)+) (EC 1.1.1.94)